MAYSLQDNIQLQLQLLTIPSKDHTHTNDMFAIHNLQSRVSSIVCLLSWVTTGKQKEMKDNTNGMISS